MKKYLIALMTTLISSSFIFFSQEELLLINIVFFISFAFSANNYFAAISIIPLFFINPNCFMLMIIFMGLMLILDIFNVKHHYKALLALILSLVTLILLKDYFNFMTFILLLSAISAIYLIILFKSQELKTAPLEILYLTFFILNGQEITWYYLLPIYLLSLLNIRLLKSDNYYHLTSFFITCYLIYKTGNLFYILIQIMAYLNHLLNFKYKVNPLNTVNYLLEDINTNVSNFCNFLNDFNSTTYAKEYEENMGKAIKILIETYCFNCKNKTYCYTGLKLETYAYMKKLLTNESLNDNGFFTCLYYQNMREKANSLSEKYHTRKKPDTTLYKIDGIALSLQNYFVHIFSIINPEMLKICNFKGLIKENKIQYSTYSYDIENQDSFTISISCHEKYLKKLENLAKDYFKKALCLNYQNGVVKIATKKRFKVVYDYATMASKVENLSGDNFLFYEEIRSSFAACLSDGMGSGYNAYKISKETLKLLSQVIECKIDFETSLQIITNMYKLKAANDVYATLDFLNINLYTGELNLFKLGATTTFLIHDKKPIAIYNTNLPFGISDFVTKERFLLSPNDYVIMVSDGVSDYLNEATILNYLETVGNASTHKIVYDLMQMVACGNKMTFQDDTSCAVIKLLAQ